MSDSIQLPLDFEIWKSIPGYEGIYEVSDQGRVKRLANTYGRNSERIRKPGITSAGYLLMHLSREGHRSASLVHQLVMQAFVGPCPSGLEINHKDGNKTNNCLTNLEYVTRSENHKHAFRLGLRKVQNKGQPGMQNGRAKLTDSDVKTIRTLYKRGVKQSVLRQQFNISRSTVQRVIYGTGWKHVKT